MVVFYKAESHEELPTVTPITTRRAVPMPSAFLPSDLNDYLFYVVE